VEVLISQWSDGLNKLLILIVREVAGLSILLLLLYGAFVA